MATERMEGMAVDELAEDALRYSSWSRKQNASVWMVEESDSIPCKAMEL
jgi:hypothetical protein